MKPTPSIDAASPSYSQSSAYLAALDAITSAQSLRPVVDLHAISMVTADFYDVVHLATPGYAKVAAAVKT